jgi:hypothetical protein
MTTKERRNNSVAFGRYYFRMPFESVFPKFVIITSKLQFLNFSYSFSEVLAVVHCDIDTDNSLLLPVLIRSLISILFHSSPQDMFRPSTMGIIR